MTWRRRLAWGAGVEVVQALVAFVGSVVEASFFLSHSGAGPGHPFRDLLSLPASAVLGSDNGLYDGNDLWVLAKLSLNGLVLGTVVVGALWLGEVRRRRGPGDRRTRWLVGGYLTTLLLLVLGILALSPSGKRYRAQRELIARAEAGDPRAAESALRALFQPRSPSEASSELDLDEVEELMASLRQSSAGASAFAADRIVGLGPAPGESLSLEGRALLVRSAELLLSAGFTTAEDLEPGPGISQVSEVAVTTERDGPGPHGEPAMWRCRIRWGMQGPRGSGLELRSVYTTIVHDSDQVGCRTRAIEGSSRELVSKLLRGLARQIR